MARESMKTRNGGMRVKLLLEDISRLCILIGVAAAFLAVVFPTALATAAAGPLWDVKATWGDTNLPPGGEGEFQLQVRNLGDEGSEEPLVISDSLPPGVIVKNIDWGTTPVSLKGEFNGFPLTVPVDLSQFCTGVGTGVATCEAPVETTTEFFGLPVTVFPTSSFKPYPEDGLPGYPGGYLPSIYIDVEVDPSASGSGSNMARIEGGGNSSPFTDQDEVRFTPNSSGFGVREGSFEADTFTAAYPFGNPDRQAGDHPFEQRVNFELNQESGIGGDGTRFVGPHGLVRTVEATLPRGMVGNPQAVPQCEPSDFATETFGSPHCPADTQVGYINTRILFGDWLHGHGGKGISFTSTKIKYVPIYNLVPPKGTPVDLAFSVAGLVQAHIYASLDPARDYAIKAVTPNISEAFPVRETEVTLWGVPGDPAHDRFRYFPEEPGFQGSPLENTGAPWGSAPIRPFYTLPTNCDVDTTGTRIRVDSYENPDAFTPDQEYAGGEKYTGCNDPRFRFQPDISLQPTSRDAGAPTGLTVHLEVPQRSDEVAEADELYASNGHVKAIPTPPLKRAVVELPQGMTLNPGAAQGLGNCSPAEIGIGTDSPVSCPDSSQFGTLTLHTPILPVDEQPEGFIYIAKQNDNPFHNFLSLYLVIQDPERGILVKIPGRIDLDPDTGQITTTFDDLPQFPVSDLEMSLKSGLRAGLVNPQTCGRKTIEADFYSWQDPSTPHHVSSSYDISFNPDGSPCHASLGERQFKPQLEAGTVNPTAATYSPFQFRLTRTDEDQEFSRLSVALPKGLVAKFAGVGICPDSEIAQAEDRTGAGQGSLEETSPSCPASSQIGTTQVGTGVGVPLAYVPGKVYLAGPYKGAPLSMVVISPAVIGPYDLGVITVRTALNVDPSTAQATAVSDLLPQIFQGIPVRIRDIHLQLDRPEFTLNPTSCAPAQIKARITGTGGDVASGADDTTADLSERFQSAECASLRFHPRFSLRLLNGTRRAAHPRFKATLRARPREANIARASVALPHSEFLDQAHIRTVCTRVQFAANSCPADSVYGSAVAETPLFDQPLRGPVYLRSSDNTLPDLVAVLRGPDAQPVEIDLVGRIDSARGGIRNTFEVIPDAPVRTFTLNMHGGKKGLLVNSVNLCSGTNRAVAKFIAQNGKRVTLRPKMQNACRRAKNKHPRRNQG